MPAYRKLIPAIALALLMGCAAQQETHDYTAEVATLAEVQKRLGISTLLAFEDQPIISAVCLETPKKVHARPEVIRAPRPADIPARMMGGEHGATQLLSDAVDGPDCAHGRSGVAVGLTEAPCPPVDDEQHR